MRLCVEARGSISVAHRVGFSPGYSSIHGHDYVVLAAVCSDSEVDVVVDAAGLTERLSALLREMDGRYLVPTADETATGGTYLVPCNAQGVTGECIARHIARSLGATWVRVCESGLTSPCFYYET